MDHDIAVVASRYAKLLGAVRTEHKSGDASADTDRYAIFTATAYPSCREPAEWSDVAEGYWPTALPPKSKIKRSNRDVALRALYLRDAVENALQILGAPPAMIADFKQLIEPLCPEGAKRRAEFQSAILENAGSSLRQGAAKAKNYSPGQVITDRENGTIVTPGEAVWERGD